jgi:hypothetical protein
MALAALEGIVLRGRLEPGAFVVRPAVTGVVRCSSRGDTFMLAGLRECRRPFAAAGSAVSRPLPLRPSASGVYTELQCGSYIFMDADTAANLDRDRAQTEAFEPSSSCGRR